VLTAQEIMLTM